MAFTCQICFEELNIAERFALPRLATGNQDVLRAKDCDHPICQECLASFVTARVQDQLVFNVRCPFDGCMNEIFEQDVKRMESAGALSSDVSKRFAELRARDYTAHAASLQQTWISLEKAGDYDLILKLWQSTRLCPRCNLVIEKSEGCNSFYCICGHHFHYDSAPRVVGNGIERFREVVSTAKSLGLSLEEVQRYGADDERPWRMARALAWNKQVNRTAAETQLSREEASQLLQQAKTGNLHAREQIRLARNRQETSIADEVEEEYHFSFNLWERSALDNGEEEYVDKQIEESHPAPITIEVLDHVSTESRLARMDTAQEKWNSECNNVIESITEKLLKNAYIKAVCANASQVENLSC